MTEAELKAIEEVARNPKYIEAADDFLPVNDIHRLVIEVRRLKGLLRTTALKKWEPHGGPHAAADHCGSQPIQDGCTCGLVELEEEALRP